jgi:hypothetical protein
VEHLTGETSCLTLVWAVLDRASAGWRGFTMISDGLRLVHSGALAVWSFQAGTGLRNVRSRKNGIDTHS